MPGTGDFASLYPLSLQQEIKSREMKVTSLKASIHYKHIRYSRVLLYMVMTTLESLKIAQDQGKHGFDDIPSTIWSHWAAGIDVIHSTWSSS